MRESCTWEFQQSACASSGAPRWCLFDGRVFAAYIRKLHFAMVPSAIMRTWSDVTKAYSATAMPLSQESSTRDDKASRRVPAYVRLHASCSLRTHVRTVTFHRFTRRMNIRVIPFMKSVETILQSCDSHLFESVNSLFTLLSRYAGKRERETRIDLECS